MARSAKIQADTQAAAKNESAKNTWRKVRWELMHELAKLTQVNPAILLGEGGEDRKIFISFVQQKFAYATYLKNHEFFTFLVLTEYDKLKEAVEEYSIKVEKVEGESLQQKARRVKNKMLKNLDSSPKLAREWDSFFKRSMESVCN